MLPNTGNDSNFKMYYDMLLKADYIGANIKIIHSRCASQIGIEGIVALETKNIFYIVAVDNRLLKIEKKHVIFSISVSDFEIEIFGTNFRTSPPFRAGGRMTTDHSLLKVLWKFRKKDSKFFLDGSLCERSDFL